LKTPVNYVTVDIFNQSNADLPVDTFKGPLKDLDFVNSVKPEGQVQSPTAHAPVIIIDGKQVSGVGNLPDPPSPLFANDVIARLNLKEIHVRPEKTIESPIELVKNFISNQSFAPKLEIEKSDATGTQKPLAAKAETVQEIIENGNEPGSGDNFSKNHSPAPVELQTEEGELLSAKM
jgi:hypothetical protein